MVDDADAWVRCDGHVRNASSASAGALSRDALKLYIDLTSLLLFVHSSFTLVTHLSTATAKLAGYILQAQECTPAIA
jgi:hypothetical protein